MSDDTIQVELETMAYGGSALGRHEGRVVFVPYTLPGEVVEARVVSEGKRVIFARGVKLVAASADRVFPACAHFGPGKCRLCQWQHIDYAAQLLIKQDVLADQLERVGGFTDPAVGAVIASPVQWGYNERMAFVPDGSGRWGFPNTEDGVETISACEVLHPDLFALYEQLDIDPAGFSRMVLARGTDGAHMVVLYADAEEAPELELDLPASVNLILPDNEPLNLAGQTHLSYTVRGRAFRVTAGSVFRGNTAALDALVGAVLAAVGEAKAVLDLYSGVGLFAAFLADKADYVTVVESYPPAATDADENTADLEHVDVIEGSVEDVLAAAEAEYDAAVVDPPGAGLSVEAVDALVALNPAVIVYVGGDAATLSRDVKRLAAHGYTLERVQPVDTAPQTYQMDMVARLVRNPGRVAKLA